VVRLFLAPTAGATLSTHAASRLDELRRVCDTVALLDRLAEAGNDSMDACERTRHMAHAAQAKRERTLQENAISDALLRELGVDPAAADPLQAVQRALCARLPAFVSRSWALAGPPPDADEAHLLAISPLRGTHCGGLLFRHGDSPQRLIAPMVMQLFAHALPSLSHRFAFAVPCDAALDAIAGLGTPVLELGAGTGYWGSLLRARGVEIALFDTEPPTAALNNVFFEGQFAEVLCGKGAQVAARAEYARHALLLVWPFSTQEHGLRGGAPWDAEAVRAFTGELVLHVGSLPGAEGDAGASRRAPGREALATTSSAELARVLRAGFALERVVETPDMPLSADELTIWRRKPTQRG
jgi:hypothetical protein